MKKILLISNSIVGNGQYLGHCFYTIKRLLKGRSKVLFIPFALKDWDKYEDLAKQSFKQAGFFLSSIHHTKDYKKAVMDAQVIFVGGGNTFRLLRELKKHNLINLIKAQVRVGKLIYIGVSAGINIACPTIKTTNDMPIVEVGNFKALGLINFQINPHFIDADSFSKHRIETREERIMQFHEENNIPVLGLREGSFLLFKDSKLFLGGKTGGKLFIKEKTPKELRPNQLLNFLL